MTEYFQLLDPLSPPPDTGQFGRLGSIVTEAALWFLEDPATGGATNLSVVGRREALTELVEAIDAAQNLISAPADEIGIGDGTRLVDLFCDRFIGGAKRYALTLRSGRTIGQRQLLCALALAQAELTARAIRSGTRREVSNRMKDVLELICEIRRTLDREAGASVNARRARQRHEKNYRMRALAHALFDKGKWPSTRQAAKAIYPQVAAFAKTIDAGLSPDRGPQTVYEWLLDYRRTPAKQT